MSFNENSETVLVGPVKYCRDSLSGKAILLEYEGADEPFWVPKSQVRWKESEVQEPGDEGILALPKWLAVAREEELGIEWRDIPDDVVKPLDVDIPF
jgi:hypothetical protein